MTITATEAGQALNSIAEALLKCQIVAPEGYSVLIRIAREMKLLRNNSNWSIEIDRGSPIIFNKFKTHQGKNVTPTIVAKEISVEQANLDCLPFKSLDIALEINDELSSPLARWHIDLANKQNGVHQSGPIVHLQYGGHHRNARELDHPLKEPRWCHPPMEVALLCEVVAANFHEEAWIEMRQEPSWCCAISLYQKLCYTHYINEFQKSLSTSSTTTLKNMWASAYDEASS